MMDKIDVVAIAAKHGLGMVSDHIFNLWDLPLQPFHTENILAFAQEIYEAGHDAGLVAGWKDGYGECLMDNDRPEGEE